MADSAAIISVPVPKEIVLDQPLDRIRYFRKQWRCYCSATGIENWPEEKKLDLLYLVIGSEAFKVISGLSLSDEEKTNAEKLLAALEKFYKPAKSVVYQRYKFNRMTQNENEDIDAYLNRISDVAHTCEYRDNTEDMVRDRFVAGLRDVSLQKELIADEFLTLRKAVAAAKQRLHSDIGLKTLYLKMNLEKKVNVLQHPVQKISIIGSETAPQIQIKQETIDHCENPLVDTTNLPEMVPSVSPAPVIQHQEVSSVKYSYSNNPSEFEPPDKRLRVDLPILESLRKDENTSERRTERTEMILTNPCTITCTSEYNLGAFVVMKTDYNSERDPPLWKIDSNSLLQKFEPFEQDGAILYKSKSVYSGWSQSSRSQYYKVSVVIRGKQINRKECIVQFLRDSVKELNLVEKRKRSLTPCDKNDTV